MPDDRAQLKKLTAPIPVSLQSDTGRSNLKAADHTVSVQWLLGSVGPYDFEIVEKLYSAPKSNKDAKVLNGVICRLTIEIDGRTVKIEEAGGLENAMNQDGDGERLKHLLSDALKRCAMRVGVGLNIWAADHYFLHKALTKGEEEKPEVQEAAEGIPEEAAAPEAEAAEEPDADPHTPESEETADQEPQAQASRGIDLSEEELPSWLMDEAEGTPEQAEAVKNMQGAASPGKPGPGGDDDPCTEEQADAIRSLATTLKGNSGVGDFENKNGPIPRLTKRQAREHIRTLGEVVKRKNAREKKTA